MLDIFLQLADSGEGPLAAFASIAVVGEMKYLHLLHHFVMILSGVFWSVRPEYNTREVFERVGKEKFLFLLRIMHQRFNGKNQNQNGDQESRNGRESWAGTL